MTNGRQGVSPDEWREMLAAAISNFNNWDIDDEEFRRKLADLGLPASEIDYIVEINMPLRDRKRDI